MRALSLVLAGVIVLAAAAAVGAALPPPLNAKQIRGTLPALKPGAERAVYLWTDDQGLHLRWTADGKPVLFSGTVEFDRAVGAIERVNKVAGGWVQATESQSVLFSATATTAVDGFDLAVTPGTTLTIDVDVNGQPIDLMTLSVGTALLHPAKLPLRFAYR